MVMEYIENDGGDILCFNSLKNPGVIIFSALCILFFWNAVFEYRVAFCRGLW